MGYRKPPPLTPTERAMPLAKYYDIPLCPPDPLTCQVLADGPIRPADALDPEHFSDLILDPGVYHEVETGYCMLEDHIGYLAVYKHSDPRVTPEMSRWYMQWQNFYPGSSAPGEGNLRYKLWMPLDHIDHHYVNGKDRTDGVYSLETLDLGGGEKPIGSIHHRFRTQEYEALGVDRRLLDRLAETGCQLRIAWESFDIPGSHFCVSLTRPSPFGGTEELCREWIGLKPVNGKLVRDPFAPVCDSYLRNVILHNTMESQHLGAFLPQLYAEYKDQPLDAD